MKPEQKFKAGGIHATVWKNKSKDGAEDYFSIGFGRTYKDKAGYWKETNSLGVGDIPKAIAVLGKAYEFCVQKEKTE